MKHAMLLLDVSTFGRFLYLASCECQQWTGQEHDTKDEAIAEWERHREMQTPIRPIPISGSSD